MNFVSLDLIDYTNRGQRDTFQYLYGPGNLERLISNLARKRNIDPSQLRLISYQKNQEITNEEQFKADRIIIIDSPNPLSGQQQKAQQKVNTIFSVQQIYAQTFPISKVKSQMKICKKEVQIAFYKQVDKNPIETQVSIDQNKEDILLYNNLPQYFQDVQQEEVQDQQVDDIGRKQLTMPSTNQYQRKINLKQKSTHIQGQQLLLDQNNTPRVHRNTLIFSPHQKNTIKEVDQEYEQSLLHNQQENEQNKIIQKQEENLKNQQKIKELLLKCKANIVDQLNQKGDLDNQDIKNLKKKLDQNREQAQKSIKEIEKQIEHIQECMRQAEHKEILVYLDRMKSLETEKQDKFSIYIEMEKEYQQRYSFLIWHEFDDKVKKIQRNLKYIETNPKLSEDQILKSALSEFRVFLEKQKKKKDDMARFQNHQFQ